MATFPTDLYDAQASDRLNTSRLPAPNQAGGGIQMAVVPYVMDGSEVQGDVIDLVTLPAGAIPVPGASFIVTEDLEAPTPTPTPTPS